MDIGHFVIRYGRTRDQLLQAVRRGIDTDLREAPAQLSGLPAPKTLISRPQVVRESPSFVSPWVGRGRHKPGV